MIKKVKIIQLPRGKVSQMADAHRCTIQCVYAALRGVTNSDLAQTIRKEALEMYGGITTTKCIIESVQ